MNIKKIKHLMLSDIVRKEMRCNNNRSTIACLFWILYYRVVESSLFCKIEERLFPSRYYYDLPPMYKYEENLAPVDDPMGSIVMRGADSMETQNTQDRPVRVRREYLLETKYDDDGILIDCYYKLINTEVIDEHRKKG